MRTLIGRILLWFIEPVQTAQLDVLAGLSRRILDGATLARARTDVASDRWNQNLAADGK